ncbi:uncharacterized protein LOC110685690 [Chenopodium quinoa]|uniref:uncharacterized protein LOC110685690 n=1 Tax=Chenopodium quinoa TaxID=63459 RepID=UPI000B78FA89|nr:uncharacterized protein LOC110685690 [Chenopodium quinoa]
MPDGVPNPRNKVCRLRKSLYGFKQASRQWFEKFKLVILGFVQSKNDYSLFVKSTNHHLTIAVVIKDLGVLSYFLGMEIGYDNHCITLSQAKFTREILEESGIKLFKSVATPLPLHLKLNSDDGDVLDDPLSYRCLVGKLNFLTHTRLNLAFTIHCLSQFMQIPRSSHMQALIHTLNYMASTTGRGIIFKGGLDLKLQAFSYSNWAAFVDSRRSITGYIMMLGSSPISWKSQKQATVSKSSSEAKYKAMAVAASKVTWLVRLLGDLGITNLKPITRHCDNLYALHIARNPVFHERTKHINIDCYFTREKVLEGLI